MSRFFFALAVVVLPLDNSLLALANSLLNPERVQKLGLIDVLGDKSPLVAAIMERVKVSAGAPGSYVDQALNYELPPRTQLTHYDVVNHTENTLRSFKKKLACKVLTLLLQVDACLTRRILIFQAAFKNFYQFGG